MKIIIASDEKTPVTVAVVSYLKQKGHDVTLGGDLVSEELKWHWAEIGTEVVQKVAERKFERGILFCWSGTGVCMAANKVDGARASLSWDSETAKLTRKWNDCNILCMSLRFTSETVAKEIVDSWLETEFDEETLDQVKHVC